MAYEPDLTDYQASSESRFSGRPLLNVGWMEPPYPMPAGNAPAGFAERLAAFCARDKLVNLTFGSQNCGFCKATFSDLYRQFNSPLGNGEIRVLGDGVAYAAPSMICHYVAAHSYLPPAEFVEAVMHGPPPDDRKYVKYRFHWWEANMQSARRHQRGEAGSILGPLVWRFRGMVWVTILIFAVAVVRPFGLVVTAAALMVLAGLWWFFRTGLQCPVCQKQMTLPFREQAGWSSPPGSVWERPWSTIYCNDCGVGLRASTDLWGDPVCEVVTNWA